MPEWLKKTSGVLVVMLVVVIVLGVLTLLVLGLPWRHVENYELAYKFSSRTGQITQLGRTGYVGRNMIFDSIHTVDLRPRQVCINANQRVLNCKLVRFNPNGLQLFVSWHGRADYNETNLDDILLSYAYDGSGRSYPFLTVLRELRAEDTPAGLSQ